VLPASAYSAIDPCIGDGTAFSEITGNGIGPAIRSSDSPSAPAAVLPALQRTHSGSVTPPTLAPGLAAGVAQINLHLPAKGVPPGVVAMQLQYGKLDGLPESQLGTYFYAK
jgi:hypothetical protein